MKAIIMAGGEGKRLKPVTGDTPKPLVQLCGRPVMEHIIMLLRRHGMTDICATVKYRAEDIIEYFGDGSRLNVKMSYSVESEPLGTAGSVKNCEDFYGSDDFLVISGDAACDIDLTALISEHNKRCPMVTIALCASPDPLRYGLALCDDEGFIRSFIEKPDWGRVVTNRVNTGIYIISPRAMELVPRGTECDFGRDLFPKLLSRGEKLLGFKCDGYWRDIGTPKSYYECCVDALSGRLDISLAGGFEREEHPKCCDPDDNGMSCRECSCSDRARLMDSVSRAFLPYGADFTDGVTIRGGDCELRISPLSAKTALHVAASASDMETASALAEKAAAFVNQLEKRLE